MLKLKVVKIHPDAQLPKRAFASAGYDVYPCYSGTIRPGEVAEIKLGIKTEFEEGYVAQVDDRGSVGKAGVTHLAGVIDSDYRGEWIVLMCNVGGTPFHYSPAKAIAQVLFVKVEAPEVEEVEELESSDRGSGRMGSSGH